MKDVSFYEVIIAKADQRIVSADSQIYDMLGRFATRPMNELIAAEDIHIYENNIKNCDGGWYPSKIIAPDTMYYCYVSAKRYNEKLITLTIVDARDLLNAHSSLMKAINALTALLGLYEDVFFEYNPETGIVSVSNTVLADFEPGDYSISNFEALLLKRATDDTQKDAIKGFITEVKTCVGRSTVMLEGNILNDDDRVTTTVLKEAFVFYDKDTEGVVGHIQLRRSRGDVKPAYLKYDSLTGLLDKVDIIRMARERIDDKHLEGTALAIIDVDYFKSINDNFGHQFGDDVIKKIADIISSEVGKNGISGRFGGDEFFAVLYDMQSEDQLRPILKGIKNKASATFPDKGMDKDNPLSVSIGASVYSKDADNYDDLFMLADHCLYLAKEKGRNRYIIYSREKHGDLDEVRLKQQSSKKINDRDSSYGDVIVKMFNLALHNKETSVENFLNEFAEAFSLDNIHLYVGSPFKYRYATGSKVIKDKPAIDYLIKLLNSDDKDRYFSLNDFVAVNHLGMLPPDEHSAREFLEKREVYSLVLIRFFDRDKKECVLGISTVGRKVQWNQSLFKYFRAFTDILSFLSLGEAD